MTSARGSLALIAAVAFAAGGCGAGPILANPPITFPSPPIPSLSPSAAADPVPISLPRDDGPHDRLTEWWYYTGHLRTESGRRFGFEAVVFRAERGDVPVAWASHLALTDEGTGVQPGGSGGQGGSFHYAQRSEVGLQVDRSPRDASGAPTGFDLQVAGLSPALIASGAPPVAAPWHLAGAGGTDRIEAALAPEEAAAAGASFGLALDLHATKAPALHDEDGFVDFGPAGSSYYYSRTRMTATGELQLDGERLEVSGIAWFDHQWGDFVSVGGEGWDWFAVNLGDGRDITISLVRDAGIIQAAYGTIVEPSGTVRHLGSDEFDASPLVSWTSARTGRTYVSEWNIQLNDGTVIHLAPTLIDQELDTRATTGVTYWEGSQVVDAEREGASIGGEAYVEMTRYDTRGG